MISILWFVLIFPIPIIIGLIAATKIHTYDAEDYLKIALGAMMWVVLLILWTDFVLRMVAKITGG
jgi:hypothetical protein